MHNLSVRLQATLAMALVATAAYAQQPEPQPQRFEAVLTRNGVAVDRQSIGMFPATLEYIKRQTKTVFCDQTTGTRRETATLFESGLRIAVGQATDAERGAQFLVKGQKQEEPSFQMVDQVGACSAYAATLAPVEPFTMVVRPGESVPLRVLGSDFEIQVRPR